MAHTQRWTIWVCPDCGATNVHAERCSGAFPGDPVVHGNRVEVVPADQFAGAVTAIGDAIQLLAGHQDGDAVDARALLKDAYARAEGQSGETDQPKET